MKQIETLSSRERVIKAIEHKTADRMPIDLGVHFSTGISAFAYRNLREYLGLSVDNIEVADCVQLLARVDEDVLERFHVDTILLNPHWKNPHKWNPRGSYEFTVPETFQPVMLQDGAWKVEFAEQALHMPENGYFFDGGWPDFYGLDADEKLNLFAARAEKIFKETDKFTMMMGYWAFFGGLEFACIMLTEPDECIIRQERALKNQIEKFDRMNSKMGSYINAIEVNSDLGSQAGLLCTPDSYELICYPYLKDFCRHVHESSNLKVFMHSCGSISQLLPYIISAGVDIINPVQISAAHMQPQYLKEKFGKDICFWGGGCDTQTVLWNSTPEQVRENVISLIDAFKPGGGFVFNQVHNIMGNVPPENIVAMFDAAYAESF